jgi:hypothetical protein
MFIPWFQVQSELVAVALILWPGMPMHLGQRGLAIWAPVKLDL